MISNNNNNNKYEENTSPSTKTAGQLKIVKKIMKLAAKVDNV
jgi:hypothetical protein